jgi:hypothetical protein
MSLNPVLQDNLNACFVVENNKLKISNMNKEILGIRDESNKIETYEDFVDRIQSVLDIIGFSSKRIDYDEFVRKSYDEESIYGYTILGSGNHYTYPRGVVCLHPSNKIFYDVANLQFMLDETFVPMHLFECNIDFNGIIKIPRSNGDLNDGTIEQNTSLKISKTLGGIYSCVAFIAPESNLEMKKNVKLDYLLEINKVDLFKLSVPKLDKSDYNFDETYEFLSNELIDEIIETYNKKMIEFMKGFVGNFPEYDVTEDHDTNQYILKNKK